jgi:hypothetical protein
VRSSKARAIVASRVVTSETLTAKQLMAPSSHLIASGPGDPADLHSFFRQTFESRPKPALIRLGFALAKTSGVDALESAVADTDAWNRVRKEWLIGTQFALTEPEALHQLGGIASSVVRLHGWRHASGPSRRAMFGVGCFHGKVIAAGDANSTQFRSLLVGSGNLTGAALGSVPMNYEAAIEVNGAVPRPLIGPFNSWWRRAWAESITLTPALIDEYARAREEVLAENPDLHRFVEASSREGPVFGNSLWIEAGATSGGSRNQIEFSEDLVPFFGPVEEGRRLLRVRLGRRLWTDRPLSFKITTLGVKIWRLSLPTDEEYPGRVVRFVRSQDPEGLTFNLEVADPSSAKYKRWRRNSEVGGHLGLTGGRRGGREYGLD